MLEAETGYAYLLLTRSPTLLSRAIHLLTGDGYTHASIALDAGLESLCSFGRRVKCAPLPAGLVRESLRQGFYADHRYMRCALFALPVDGAAYARLRRRRAAMLKQRKRYRYNFWGLPLCRLGISWRRRNHYFCSEFVAELLATEAGAALPLPPARMRPQDLLRVRGLRCLYRGRLSGLMHDPRQLIRRQLLSFEDVK